MGSSKKHKDKEKDHKRKKRHRSRSRSRERKHKKDKREDKYDKKVKKEDDDQQYYEEGEIPGLDLVSIKKEEHLTTDYDDYQDYASGGADIGESSGQGGGDESLSIEETNRLRAQLGLRPLDVGAVKAEDDDFKPAKKEDVHAPAANLTEIKRTEKLREKMEQIRQKRKMNQQLGKVKTLGESDDEDDSALAWINKSRKKQHEKEMAEKRAKMLDAMDEEFGISDLIDEEFADTKKKKEYGSKDLRGMTVEHGQETFTEGKTVILTLKDKGILDDGEDEDVLMNVNMADDERYRESVENKKKKPAYNPYDDSEIDEFGMHKPREVLDKYDEEIDGKKKDKFQLGSGGQYDAQHERQMKKFKEDVAQMGETLTLPSPVIASEFYTEQEMASFKKPKKKVRKLRKKPKVVTADDLIPLDSQDDVDHGSRGGRRMRRHEDEAAAIPGLDLVAMEVDDRPVLDEAEIMGPEEDLTGVSVEDDAMNDLESALNKARKLKQKKRVEPEKKVLQHVRVVGMEEGSDDEETGSKLPGVNIVLNSTSEFCRTLGDIPTYGQAGNREEDEEELLDFERELAEERRRKLEEEEKGATGWMSVEIDETPVDITKEEKGPLDEEPVLNSGIASALQLGLKKGYFEEEKLKKISAPKHKTLEAKNYSIEDKRYDDLDEKYNKRQRDRFGSGVTMEFKDLNNYKPNVKIDYIDESGRNLNQKEAFRALSHRFHGKGSGKRKQEKRSKKLEQENLLMQASSTDTPLGTVAMLQEKQKVEKTPYIVLSGSNKGMTASTLTKS